MSARMLLVCMMCAIALSACGVKGPLDPPPPKDAKKQERTSGN